MTIFSLIYGIIYLSIWFLIFNSLKAYLSPWISGVVGVVGVLVFRWFLVWTGEISMRRHQEKNKKNKEDDISSVSES